MRSDSLDWFKSGYGIVDVSVERSVQWLVDDVLALDQLIVISGPARSDKSTIAVDLAISISSGTLFLGHFPTQWRRVVMFNGENRTDDLRSMVRMVQATKHAGSDFLLAERLPDISSARDVRILADRLKDMDVQVAIVDPLLADSLRQSELHEATRVLLAAGVTPVFVVGTAQKLAWSRVCSAARQRMFISRCGLRKSQLRLLISSTLGDSGWNIDISEELYSVHVEPAHSTDCLHLFGTELSPLQANQLGALVHTRSEPFGLH